MVIPVGGVQVYEFIPVTGVIEYTAEVNPQTPFGPEIVPVNIGAAEVKPALATPVLVPHAFVEATVNVPVVNPEPGVTINDEVPCPEEMLIPLGTVQV